ncbi:MAG: histidine kinase, partial [Candidatus Eisenbacteria bacterium]
MEGGGGSIELGSVVNAVAALLATQPSSTESTITRVLEAVRSGIRHPGLASVRLQFQGRILENPTYRPSAWTARTGDHFAPDRLEVAYREIPSDGERSPFLPEEQVMLEAVLALLRLHSARAAADEASSAVQLKLEHQREQLRRLAAEVSLIEARERREIAADLHDHLGQALAFMRLQLADLAGNAVFTGFEASLERLLTLLDQAIRYTRNLTGEVSPPVLYELGLPAAVDWLAEHLERKHGTRIAAKTARGFPALPQVARVMLWKAVGELLTNAIKHARATKINVELRREGSMVLVEVRDDGRGFDPIEAEQRAADPIG